MTNHKSKAQEIKRKWMESPAAMSRDCKLEELIASALREAEISGARKMREKAIERADNVFEGEHNIGAIADAIYQRSPESVEEDCNYIKSELDRYKGMWRNAEDSNIKLLAMIAKYRDELALMKQKQQKGE